MISIAELISTTRKRKQLTQEELADLSKVNLRTIQRIENRENVPRGNTLKLICEALDLEFPNVEVELTPTKTSNYVEIFFNYFFLVIINLALMSIIGLMTLDSFATWTSRFAGLLLSFFIPIFIVFKTSTMSRNERVLKFGSGFLFHIIFSIIMVGFPKAFVSGLLICLAICLLTLYYGDLVMKKD